MSIHIRHELRDHPLAKAEREVNAYAETHGLEANCEHYDLKQQDVRYIPEQRARLHHAAGVIKRSYQD
jgi:hypothetical protein